jgi:hypothetical protein
MARTLVTGNILRSGSIPTTALGGGVVSSSAQTLAHLEGQVVKTGVISASGHIVPTANEVYDLGSSTNQFRDLYLSGSTIYLGGLKISERNGALSVKKTIRVNDAIEPDPTDADTPLTGVFSGSFSGSGANLVGVVYNHLSSVPQNIVSHSAQVKAFLPEGSVSHSSQIVYGQLSNVPANIVSHSTQVRDFLPTGTVSHSAQVQLNTVTGTTFADVDFTFPQNLTVGGRITAEEFHTEYVSSSVGVSFIFYGCHRYTRK